MTHSTGTQGAVRGAWWSSVAMFLVHGLVVATWVSRIPTVQSGLGMSNAQLGLTLLGTACGSVLAIPCCGWLVTRFGTRKIVPWSTLGFCLALLPLSAANTPLRLAAALFAFGAFAGTMDVSMNVQGVEAEKALGRPTMSRFHAMFSMGGMLGAALGGVAASRHLDRRLHFAIAAAVCLAVALPFFRSMNPTRHVASARERLRHIPPGLIAIAAIAFCMLVCEGAMADWTGVYLRQNLAAGPGTAAAGYAVFSAAMALFRLLGDAITERLGGVASIRAGSLLAAAGVAAAMAAPSAAWALPGFAAAGAGFSVIVPLVFGAGARVPGVSPGAGVAAVTGTGYIGFLVGPPAIGFTAQAITLRYALGIVVALCLLSASLARRTEAV